MSDTYFRINAQYLMSVAVDCVQGKDGVYYPVNNKKIDRKHEQHFSFRYRNYWSYKNKT